MSDDSAATATTLTDSDSDSQEQSLPRDSLNSLLEASVKGGGEDCLSQCAGAVCENPQERRKAVCCSSVAQCVWGILLLTISVGGCIFTPLDFMLWEKLNMRPGFPPYDWWADPPDEVRLRVYVFNVTNHDRFVQGLDAKLDVQELGPVVYLEKLLHSNVRFNENSTLTYIAKRYPIYLPEENHLDLNATIIVPNLALLGIASYLHNAPYLVRAGFRFIASSHGSEFFIKKTIYEYLWDYKEPILDTSRSLVPGMVPVTNMGMLNRVYSDFTDELTVTIGQRWGHERFFQIDRFNGEPQLPGYDPNACPDRIFGSTEGVMYHQHMSKRDVLLYWRKTVCKLMPLYFDSELTLDSVHVYRYNLSESVFERVTNGTDCYDTEPSLPAGISDGSKCYFGFPMVISYPHFYTGGVPKDHFVTGLQPDRYKHNSYTIVEPLTGTPFRSVARMQSNLRIQDLSGFSKEYAKFSNLILPLFWAEYNQEGLPHQIQSTIHFMTVILPPLSTVILAITLLLSCYILFRQIYIHKFKNDSLNSVLQLQCNQNRALAGTKWFANEKEAFLNMPS
ncbi:scavenger receptor class B member 1-like [Choristoneura fumiferana]|uniref:scavenger receptor class B member 1-like n=1 Tax=Choristoneura fumiferana TaxID=7141 RepID=UPI003D1550EE